MDPETDTYPGNEPLFCETVVDEESTLLDVTLPDLDQLGL